MPTFSRSSLVLFACAALTARAQTPAAPPAAPAPLVLDRVVVAEKLDKARADIAPSLGAAEFRIDRVQLDAQALGLDASFNNVLLRVPGVAQDSFGQVHLRGEHADLQYRINDVLLPEGLTGFGQELDTRFAESVNVLTGALPAQFGYRTAGIVDIHTRTGAETGGEITLSGGSFDTLRASAEGTFSRGNASGYVTASADRTNLGVENPTSRRDAQHDRKTQQKVFGYFSSVLDASSRLNLMFSASFARFQIPNNPDQDPAFTLAGVPTFDSAQLDENQREENHYLIAAYQKSTADLGLQVSAFTRYSLVAFAPDRAGDLIFNGVASRVHRAIVSNGLEADAKWSLGADHTVRAGAIATSTNAGTRTTTSVFATTPSGAQASTAPFDVPDDRRKLGWLAGVYAQDEWKVAEPLTVNAGLRADTWHGYLNEGQLSPRVNVVYKLGRDTSLHAGYARYFTPPPLELVQTATIGKFAGTTNAPAIDSSSPVRSERAHYFDAGLTQQVTKDLSLTLNGYAKRATQLLDEGQFGSALIFSPFNYRRGRIYGAELSANYTHGGLSAYANVAAGRATAREIVSGEFQFDPEELAYIATHDVNLDHEQILTGSAGVSYRARDTLVYADFLYGSGLRNDFANTKHLPEYHPVSLGAEHTFKRGGRRQIRARVDVVNVFDEVYALRDGSGIGVGAPQFGSRRGFYGSLTWAF